LLKEVFGFFSSLRTAIPLLVVTIAVTIGGSLFPTPDLFKTWWYLGLLGLNGISLLFITILHIPMILERKGRKALIGVVVTHAGILILIVGAIYGGMSGFRYEIMAIEDEVAIVPGLPFAIHLEKLDIEEYPQDTFPSMSPQSALKKKQDSHITLLKNGQNWASFIIRPGNPAKIEGITILPSLNETGWYFELLANNPVVHRQKTIPVKPWEPTVVELDTKSVMVHSLDDEKELKAQVFTNEDGNLTVLGVVSRDQGLEYDGYSITMGESKPYTGLTIYNRPHEPILVTGCLAMLLGLVWHFYFRHRDRSAKTK